MISILVQYGTQSYPILVEKKMCGMLNTMPNTIIKAHVFFALCTVLNEEDLCGLIIP